MADLLPCPHCGSKPVINHDWHAGEGERFWLVCPNPLCYSGHKLPREQAIEAWNRRAPASPAPAKESAPPDPNGASAIGTKSGGNSLGGADPEQPSAALADELEQWSMQLTANKQALQHYMDGFYALCIEHGVPASKAAGWAKHTEQAANTIHRIAERAIAAASLRSVEPAPRGEQDYKALYHELLYQVGKKWEGETRHQTALRYIVQAEAPRASDSQACAAGREGKAT